MMAGYAGAKCYDGHDLSVMMTKTKCYDSAFKCYDTQVLDVLAAKVSVIVAELT